MHDCERGNATRHERYVDKEIKRNVILVVELEDATRRAVLLLQGKGRSNTILVVACMLRAELLAVFREQGTRAPQNVKVARYPLRV
eukprot:2296757-Rhodomonas_salina.1